MTELAERDLLGYPGAKVALHVEGRSYKVTITDPQGQIVWKPVTKADASSMYFHPFVHGYNYRSASTYEGEDGA